MGEEKYEQSEQSKFSIFHPSILALLLLLGSWISLLFSRSFFLSFPTAACPASYPSPLICSLSYHNFSSPLPLTPASPLYLSLKHTKLFQNIWNWTSVELLRCFTFAFDDCCRTWVGWEMRHQELSRAELAGCSSTRPSELRECRSRMQRVCNVNSAIFWIRWKTVLTSWCHRKTHRANLTD